MLKRIVLVLAIMLVATVPALAQEEAEPTWTPTPHYLNPPSLPVKGPIIRRYPGQPGPMPREGQSSSPPKVGITIDGYAFMMNRGPCMFKVGAAIQAHDDLFTGDKNCDEQIRQAREIQRQKEADDPSYANEPRATPEPKPSTSGQSDQ